MRLKELKLPSLTLLAIVFTVALTFATLELPGILNSVLRGYFPDIYWEPESIEALMNYARPIGYVCLVVVIARLGDISYLPYWIVMYPLRLLGVGGMQLWPAGNLLASLVIGAGLLLFCVGTFTWFYGKSENKKVFDFWIYKYSRHPQYLGFILWSYGVMLLTTLAPVPFGGYQPEPSLPWLISMLLVICVALTEEITMIRQADESYLTYRRSAPFMLPLPRFLSRMFTAPNRILLKKDYPESGRQVLYTFVTYCTILILLSILIQQLNLFGGILRFF